MPNFAHAVLAGHLGKDPETRQAGSTTVTSFSLAVNTGLGERKVTTWWNISIFGKRGEKAAELLRKGTAVIVSGEPQLRTYQGQQGEGKSLDLKADNWTFATAKVEAMKPADSGPQPAFDDDIPF